MFESASWALASYRMPEERKRSLWQEPLPAVELTDRLREVPLFAFVSVDELFRLADAGKQIRHVTGEVLYEEGMPLESFHILLEGKLDLGKRSGVSRNIEPPALLGLEEVLEGSLARETARAIDKSVVLTLTAEQYRQLLVDNTDLVQGLFRTVLDDPQFAAGRLVMKGTGPTQLAKLAAGGLLPIERVLVLRLIPLFARATSDDLQAGGRHARGPLDSRGAAFHRGGAGRAVHARRWRGDARLCLRISCRWKRQRCDRRVQTLAGVPLGRQARVVQEGLALKIDREALFDLLAHRPMLTQEIFGALFRARSSEVVTTSTRYAPSEPPHRGSGSPAESIPREASSLGPAFIPKKFFSRVNAFTGFITAVFMPAV